MTKTAHLGGNICCSPYPDQIVRAANASSSNEQIASIYANGVANSIGGIGERLFDCQHQRAVLGEGVGRKTRIAVFLGTGHNL